MGCFDSVEVPCGKCGADVEFQSKAGECYLETYTLDDAPKAILGDLDGKSEICPVCTAEVTVRVQLTARAVTS